MATKPTAAQKGVLLVAVHELVRLTLNGTRPFEAVCDAVRDINEGRFNQAGTVPPVLRLRSFGSQIERVSTFLELYGEGQVGFRPSDVPEVPDFVPTTETEVLLLAVYLPNKPRVKGLRRTFDAWWSFIEPPTGVLKERAGDLNGDSRHLRLVPGVDYTPGIRWIAFDPNRYQGVTPRAALVQSATDGTHLAGVEVLMAAALLPKWMVGVDGDKSPHPNMPGLQSFKNNSWSCTPYLNRWRVNHPLFLDDFPSVNTRLISRWSNPTIRVLN